MTATDIFWLAHTGLPREAPGSDATTRLLFRLAQPLAPQPRVIDIGAGTSPASLLLAAEDAEVTRHSEPNGGFPAPGKAPFGTEWRFRAPAKMQIRLAQAG
ncbi:MAG: hypothetical protein ACRDTA_11985 [Pseudonocardiaceae bacterium]